MLIFSSFSFDFEIGDKFIAYFVNILLKQYIFRL